MTEEFEKQFPSLNMKLVTVRSEIINKDDINIYSELELNEEDLMKCCIDKQKVKESIEKEIAKHKQHQLTRMRFPGNLENQLIDDARHNGAIQALEDLRDKLRSDKKWQ